MFPYLIKIQFIFSKKLLLFHKWRPYKCTHTSCCMMHYYICKVFCADSCQSVPWRINKWQHFCMMVMMMMLEKKNNMKNTPNIPKNVYYFVLCNLISILCFGCIHIARVHFPVISFALYRPSPFKCIPNVSNSVHRYTYAIICSNRHRK